jgi:uncharacterized SAM-binding protein YcdF (DUF218 family)
MDIRQITNYIFVPAEAQKADLAFIFGTRQYQGAVNVAYDLYQKDLVSKILVSGGINRLSSENEALVIFQKLIALGVNECDIVVEDKSTNTLENVLLSKDVIEENIGLKNIQKIIAVVKNYHSRRALMTFKKHFPKHIKFVIADYEVYDFNINNWSESEQGREKVFGEYEKIQKYLAKGDIEEL